MTKMNKARRALNLTQAKMAKALGRSQSFVSKVESGWPLDKTTSLAIDALLQKAKEKADA